ncbi:MFS transporter [Bacillus sp. UMB0893]|uniref:MFS transporter n=1 Tax=Bacillus sp. UMB0893 TaxID=2066053 RepID=UPI000C78072F|nr:MFS transporter [Bacillus sp. UMB0893]PLR66308.1 hypothetical protein CYJ36_19645 [Bacillus sp. UMB0893]
MKNVSMLFMSQLLSAFASTLGTFCISWIVYEQTGSKLAMGGLWLVNIGGQLIIQFLAGPFIDRWKRTTMMKASEMIRYLAFLLIWFALLTGNASTVFLYITAFLTSLVVYDAAAGALVPKLAKSEELIKVNARISGGVQFVRFITLPLAGLFIAFIGYLDALFLVFSLFFVSYWIIAGINESTIEMTQKLSWAKQFKQGLRIYKKHPILLILGGFISVTSFGVFATQAMYIPYVAEILSGSSFEYGLFAASFPLGYIIGSYAAGKLNEPLQSLYRIMMFVLFIGGCTYLALGITNVLWAAILIEVIAGAAMPFWNIYSTTLYQRLVPNTILGQVLSVRFLLTKAAAPLGILYGAFCASKYGIPVLFLSVGMLICIMSCSGLVLLSRNRTGNLKKEKWI